MVNKIKKTEKSQWNPENNKKQENQENQTTLQSSDDETKAAWRWSRKVRLTLAHCDDRGRQKKTGKGQHAANEELSHRVRPTAGGRGAREGSNAPGRGFSYVATSHDMTRCDAIWHDVTRFYMMWYHVKTMLLEMTPCHTMLQDATPCYTMCYHVTRYGMLHNVTWCYTMSPSVTRYGV